MAVSENGVFPLNHPLKNREISIIFTIHFGGFTTPIFGFPHPYLSTNPFCQLENVNFSASEI